MRPSLPSGERGFTLVELLMSITILGIIAFVLTESVILGLRTTESTANRVSSSMAAQVLSSQFLSDAQNAEQVATSGGTCGDSNVFLSLRSRVPVPATISYSLVADPSAPGEYDVVRLACVANSQTQQRTLGHFVLEDDAGPVPVSVLCQLEGTVEQVACPPTATAVEAVTMVIHTDAWLHGDDAVELTVRRRTT